MIHGKMDSRVKKWILKVEVADLEIRWNFQTAGISTFCGSQYTCVGTGTHTLRIHPSWKIACYSW